MTTSTAPAAPSAAPAAPGTAAPAASFAVLARWELRLHRPAWWLWLGLVLLTGAALLWLGGPLTDASAAAWRQWNSCVGSPSCRYEQPAILLHKDVYGYTTWAVLAVPVLAAAWAGAQTGRAVELGTARLAWTLNVSPARWLAAVLAVPAVLVTAGTGLLVGLHRWMWTAGEGRIDTAKPWYGAETFWANGPLPVALALAGLALGTLAGLATGGALPALVRGAAGTALLGAGTQLALPWLWPAVTREGELNGTLPGTGIDVARGLVTADRRRVGDQGCLDRSGAGCRDLLDRVDAVGTYHVFHPSAHFWPLQLTAGALLLLVAAALTAAAFRLLRRRTG
jgi:hypothetical protein